MTVDKVIDEDRELLPCPFCGGEATTVNNHWAGSDHWSGMCDGDCGVFLDSRCDTKAEAITAWNTRPSTQSRVVEVLKDLMDAARSEWDTANRASPRLTEVLAEADSLLSEVEG